MAKDDRTNHKVKDDINRKSKKKESSPVSKIKQTATLSNTRKSPRFESQTTPNPSPLNKKIEKPIGPSPLRRSDRGKKSVEISVSPKTNSKKQKTTTDSTPVAEVVVEDKGNENKVSENDGRKRKRMTARLYKSLFAHQRIIVESVDDDDDDEEDKSPEANTNCNGDVDKSEKVLEASDEYGKVVLLDENEENVGITKPEDGKTSEKVVEACDNDVTTNIQNSGDIILNSSKFIEFCVPVQLSNVQLEQYCATLLSNAMALRSCLKKETCGVLHDILVSNRKCCNHPYAVDPKLQTELGKNYEPNMLLNVGIKSSGKLHFLDLILPEIKKRQQRVLILFKPTPSGTSSGSSLSVGQIIIDYIHFRYGEESFECIDGVGIIPSKKQAALNTFNNNMNRFIFLLEHRSCHMSIKLSSIDMIIIFDSDLNPAYDLRALQKICINSNSKQIMIFRLYSSSTLEEKFLKQNVMDNRLLAKNRYINSLLMWGASDLFNKLTEFHNQSGQDISSEESFLKDVVEEFLYIISHKSENKDSTKSMITQVQRCGIYNSEIKSNLSDDQPNLFWKKLLEGRCPIWKFVSISTPRQRKRAHYFGDSTGATDVGGVKLRKRNVNNSKNNNNNDNAQLKTVIEEDTGGVNEGGSWVPAENEPVAVSNETSIHALLKPTVSEICNVLKFSEDVKINVNKFLDFVLDSYYVNKEYTSILQAFMISLCWIGGAISNKEMDRNETFDIVKNHMDFSCTLEEAKSVYSKLQLAKEAFLLETVNLETENVDLSENHQESCNEEEVVNKCEDVCRKNEEMIEKFNKEWDEKRENLENDYNLDQSLIRALHNNLSLRLDKLKILENEFANKMEEYQRLREIHRKDLEATFMGQVAADGKIHDLSEFIGEITVDGVAGADATGETPSQEHDDVAGSHGDDDVAPSVETAGKENADKGADVVEEGDENGVDDVVPRGMPAGNEERAEDAGEDLNDECGSSSSTPPSADLPQPSVHPIPPSPNLPQPSVQLIPEIETEPFQIQHDDGDGQPDPISLGEIDAGQIIPEASSLDPDDELIPITITENQTVALIPASEAPEEQQPDLPSSAETQNHPSRTDLDMFDNLNHAGPTHSDPLQQEVERLLAVKDNVFKFHLETKQTLTTDCDKEIAEMIAQIKLKYENKLKDAEAAFTLKNTKLESNINNVIMNKVLANAFRSKCQDLAPSGTQNAGLMQQMHTFSSPSFMRRSVGAASTTPGQSSRSQQTPPPLPPSPPPTSRPLQPPLQIVHEPAALFSTPPTRPPPPPSTTTLRPPSNTPITPSNRPPPVINPIDMSITNPRISSAPTPITRPVTNSEIRAPPPHMVPRASSEIRAPPPHMRSQGVTNGAIRAPIRPMGRSPAPHMRSFRPNFVTQGRTLPGHHSPPLTPLPPLPTSSPPPLPPLPPESPIAPPPPPPPESYIAPPPPPPSISSPSLTSTDNLNAARWHNILTTPPNSNLICLSDDDD